MISVLSFNDARKKEAAAQAAEGPPSRSSDLRQTTYLEAVRAAAALANASDHTADEVKDARDEVFWRDLYRCTADQVESPDVATAMVESRALAKFDPDLVALAKPKGAALALARALRDSYQRNYPLDAR